MQLVLVVLALLCSCSLLTPFDFDPLLSHGDGGAGDGGADSGDGMTDADAPVDVDVGPAEPGTMTFVVDELEVVTDRFCDLDGDGVPDNAIADLTPTLASVFARALNTTVSGLIEERDERIVVHFPWVDDVNGPNDDGTRLMVATGYAADWPGHPEDDFDGAAQFYSHYDSFDACGEPRYVLLDASIERGALDATDGSVAIPSLARFRDATLRGAIAAGGVEADFESCGVVLIGEIGSGSGLIENSGLSTLEVVLAGGAAFGIDTVPGLEPDLDLDGDGLERIDLDENNEISQCIDGDRTTIVGRDCWTDPRMADGFSMNVRLHAVSAELLGPAPFLNSPGGGVCDDPPAESLWGRCTDPEQRICSTRETRECEARECEAGGGAAGVEACSWDCSGWLPCGREESTTQTFVTCDDVSLHGWDRVGESFEEQPATCASATVELIAGNREVRGVSLSGPVVVGQGTVAITAIVSTYCAAPLEEPPADGWAVVAYIDAEDRFGGEPFVGTDGRGEVGVNRDRRGYSLEWRFTDFRRAPDENDFITLRPIDGSGAAWEDVDVFCSQYFCEHFPERTLDLGASTTVSRNQGLRLLLRPDDPTTEDVNEQAVSGELTWGRGARGERTFLGCNGDGCPVAILPGTVLQVGVTSASDALGARVGVQTGGITARVDRPCE